MASSSRPADNKTVRVFISSTFRDMHAERDVLVTVVFPALRERLEGLGLDFFDVDLRWGVPETGVDGERANSWAYCRQWIDRVEPFFVCMLGQRYGWLPPPEEIANEADRTAYEGLSITEMEIRHAALRSDTRHRSFFYFRSAEVPPEPATAPDVYGRFVDTAEQAKLDALKIAIAGTRRPVRQYPCRWTGDGFAELDAFGDSVLEDLWSGVLRDERYVPKAAWQAALGHDPTDDTLYSDESRTVPEDVWTRIVDAARPTPADPLDAEAQQMAAFAEARLRWFKGRGHELGQLRAFVEEPQPDDASRICVVQAAAGAGKSALLAKLANDLAASSHLVLSHFVGATERSADARSLLERLVKELDRNAIPHEAEEDKLDLESLTRRLASRLEAYSASRRIVLIIDGVNQLTDGHDLAWLPYRLGESVRVVLSCIDAAGAPEPSAEAKVAAGVSRRAPAPTVLPLLPLTESDVREIVRDFLLEYCKELDREQQDAIATMSAVRNPLYLLVMLHELRTLGGEGMHLKVRDIIAELPTRYPDTISLFDWMLARLEVFGGAAVRRWWIYLSLGRVGMSGRELRDLLQAARVEDGARSALKIERSARRYLQHRGAQLDFLHRQLRDAVVRRYGPGDPVSCHAEVAAYFDSRWTQGDRHAITELPFHLAHALQQTNLDRLLGSLRYLDARVSVGGAYDLASDYARLSEAGGSSEWHQFIRRHVQTLSKHPLALVSLVGHEGHQAGRAQAIEGRWRFPWIRTSAEAQPKTDSSRLALRADMKAAMRFEHAQAKAYACDRQLVFCFDRLGTVSVVDIHTMRQLDIRLPIRSGRPLRLCCSPNGSSLIVFYESGTAELYRCILDDDGRPSGTTSVCQVPYHLPDVDDPIVEWHDGRYYFQLADDTLGLLDPQTGIVVANRFSSDAAGELAALVFTENRGYCVVIRQRGGVLLIGPDGHTLIRERANVTAACACGPLVAVAFADSTAVLYDVSDGVRAVDSVRVGPLRGALGWDGERLLWLADDNGFCARRLGEPSAQGVQDAEALFRATLHVIPRQWITLGNGDVLLLSTHTLARFRVVDGGAEHSSRVEHLFGGPVWRAVRIQAKTQWLWEREPLRAIELGSDISGRLYCAPDGRGRFYSVDVEGRGTVWDLETLASRSIRNAPMALNVATGDPDTGCWLTDRLGDIHYVGSDGNCRLVAKVSIDGLLGSTIDICGDYLVWRGYAPHWYPDTGMDMARTFVCFRRFTDPIPKLERLGERRFAVREGVCLDLAYAAPPRRLVALWHLESGHTVLRTATVEDFFDGRFLDYPLGDIGRLSSSHIAMSPDGSLLGIINGFGELACIEVETGRIMAQLPSSSPFTQIAPGSGGARFWVTETRDRIFGCDLVSP